jgi:hypothetical protein
MSDGSRIPQARRQHPAMWGFLAAALVLVGLLALGLMLDSDSPDDRGSWDVSSVPCDGLATMIRNPGSADESLKEALADEYAERCVTNGSAGVASNAGPGFYGNGNCDRYCLMAVLARQSGVML